MDDDRIPATHDLVYCYVVAKREVVEAGYIDEIAWQQRICVTDVDQTSFMREAAWVVLSAGMRELGFRTSRTAFGGIYGPGL